MEPDVQEQFRALREDNRALREEMREDIGGLHAKLDRHIAALNARCERRGEEIAVLMNHDRARDRRVDRRIALGVLIIAATSLLVRFVLS